MLLGHRVVVLNRYQQRVPATRYCSRGNVRRVEQVPRQPGASTVAFLSTVKQWVRKNGSSIQKKSIGTCIRRLTIKTSVSLASSFGSALLAFRKVCQKGAGRVGA